MKTLSCTLCLSSLLVIRSLGLAGEAPALPDAALQLQNTYNQAIETASKPIRERYLADLKKLQEQATRAGKLPEALAVKREIDRMLARRLIGLWAFPDATITIQGDGTARHTNGAVGTWQVEDTHVVLKWNNGFVHRYPLAETGDKIHGRETNPDGKMRDYVLTRMP